MHESIKVTCVFVFMVAAVVACVAWFDDRPSQTTWIVRAVSTALALISIGVFLRLHWKRDLAPDLLAPQVGAYFERNGFCFNFAPLAVDGTCVIRVFFQNRFENECIARIAVRPVAFIRKYETLGLIIVRCPGGAFGMAERAVGLPAELQGKHVSFDVGADVEYPYGKGRTLRFKDGAIIRRNTDFVSVFARTTTILALFGGMILLHRPARVRCKLPTGVATELPSSVPDLPIIIWQPGDPLPN